VLKRIWYKRRDKMLTSMVGPNDDEYEERDTGPDDDDGDDDDKGKRIPPGTGPNDDDGGQGLKV
jgi:hypothetical protein